MPVFHLEARAEMISAALWYDSREAGLGAKFLAAVIETSERVMLLPVTFPVAARVGRCRIRRAMVTGFPYSLRYEQVDDDVQILAVAHQKRGGRYWITRVS